MIHETAEIEDCTIEQGTNVWQYAHIRKGASIGRDTVIARGVFVDHDVSIGARCKIGNYACVYWPAVIGEGVFIGPHAVLTNDKHPSAINEDGTVKGISDWSPAGVTVKHGASIGACAVIVAGVTIGAFAKIGAGAVVTHDVPDGETWVGCPARKLDCP